MLVQAADSLRENFVTENAEDALRQVVATIRNPLIEFFFLRSVTHQKVIGRQYLIPANSKLLISADDLVTVLEHYLHSHRKTIGLEYQTKPAILKKIQSERLKTVNSSGVHLRYQELPVKVSGRKDWRLNDREWREHLCKQMGQGSPNAIISPSYVSYGWVKGILDEMHSNPTMTQRLMNLCSKVFGMAAWSDAAFPVVSGNEDVRWLRTVHAMGYSVLCNQNYGSKRRITFSNRRLFEKGWSKHQIMQKSWSFSNHLSLPRKDFLRVLTTNASDASRMEFLLLNLYRKGEQYNNIQHTKPREAYPPSFNFGLAPPPLSLAPLGWCAIIDSYNGFSSFGPVERLSLLEEEYRMKYRMKQRYWRAVSRHSNRIELANPMGLWR